MNIRVLVVGILLGALTTPVTAQTQTGAPAGTTKFSKPVEIVISRDIRNPDRFIDELISKTRKPAEQARLQTIKALDHEAKVKWLLGNSSESGQPRLRTAQVIGPAAVCALAIVVATVVVIVGYYLSDDGTKVAITEERQVEKQVKVCPK